MIVPPPRDTSGIAPRWATPRTPDRPTFGPAVAEVAAALGRPLQPWQRQVADVALEVLPDGSWAYRRIVVHVQRRAGKTTLILPVSLHRTLIRHLARTWFTAQKRQDARDTWMECAELVKASPLADLIVTRRSNGSEALTSPTGSTFRVFAPNEDGLHGKSSEIVTVDEGWAFDAAEAAALEQAVVPTFGTTGGQLWLPSTAGTAASTYYRGQVDRGRASVEAGSRSGVAHFEWSVTQPVRERAENVLTEAHRRPGGARAAYETDPALETEVRSVVDLVLLAHPGAYLRPNTVLDAALDMAPGEFLRAYGNVWTRTDDRVIPEHVWALGLTRDLEPPAGRIALALDVAPDRSHGAVAAAWRDGATPAVDVLDARTGSSWLVERVEELAARWRADEVGVDAAGPALDIADALERRGRVKVRRYGGREYVAACSGFLASVDAGMLRHRGSPDLDTAVANAAQRPLGDGGWAWSRRGSSGSIAPLVAATVALWTFDHAPDPPARPVVVSGRPAPRRGSTLVVR
jgi:hypothetical protein